MAIRSLEYLKAKFETGDKPTQDDFTDMLETLYSTGGGTANIHGWGVTPDTDPEDNTTRLQAAVNELEAAGGGSIYAPAGLYDFYSPVVIKNNIEIFGDGAATHFRNVRTDPVEWPYGHVFLFGTYWGWGTAASFWNEASTSFTDTAAGAYEVTVDDPTGFVVGTIVALRCGHPNNDRFTGSAKDPLDTRFGYYSPCWMTEITAVDDDLLTLAHPIPVAMVTNNGDAPRIYRETGTLTYSSFDDYPCNMAKHCSLRNMQVSQLNTGQVAIHVSSYRCKFSNLYLSQGALIGNPNAHSKFIDNNIDCGPTGFELAYLHVGLTVSGNHFTNKHDLPSWVTYAPTLTLTEGGGSCIVTDNHILTPARDVPTTLLGAIYVGAGDYASQIIGNQIVGSKGAGIHSIGDDTIISHNRISGCNKAAIELVYGSRCTISNNRISDCDLGGTDAGAIYIVGQEESVQDGILYPTDNIVAENIISGTETRIRTTYGEQLVVNNLPDPGGYASLREDYDYTSLGMIQHTGTTDETTIYTDTIDAELFPSGVGAYYVMRCQIIGNNSVAYAAAEKVVRVYFFGTLVFTQTWTAGTYGAIDIDLRVLWVGGTPISVISEYEQTDSSGTRKGGYSVVSLSEAPIDNDIEIRVTAQINDAAKYMRFDRVKIAFD